MDGVPLPLFLLDYMVVTPYGLLRALTLVIFQMLSTPSYFLSTVTKVMCNIVIAKAHFIGCFP